MWNHSTYVNPIKFNGTGLRFLHNYIYEGSDLFHPRGRHKDYPHVPDLRSEVAFNVWQNAIDNGVKFDGVQARMNLRFHHNLVLQDHDALGDFFPTRYNLLRGGERYTADFKGLTAAPRLGQTPPTRFLLQPGSPAIDAGRVRDDYHQHNVTDGKPDLGALEFGETIDDWRAVFGPAGPTWIAASEAEQLAPHRPPWPDPLDRRWGGLDAVKTTERGE